MGCQATHLRYNVSILALTVGHRLNRVVTVQPFRL
jgi:hypothetical protein